MDWNNQVGHRIEHIFPRVKVSFKESWSAFRHFYILNISTFIGGKTVSVGAAAWMTIPGKVYFIEILYEASFTMFMMLHMLPVVWSFNWPRVNHFDLTTAGLRIPQLLAIITKYANLKQKCVSGKNIYDAR